jgi:signal transduction histidine kinase
MVIFCLAFLYVITSGFDSLAFEEKLNKRVFVLHSYYQGYKWTDDENTGIHAVLNRAIGGNNIHIEYMDTKKVYGDQYFDRLSEVYKMKFRDYRFDLIIVTDNNAFEFIKKYRDSLFPNTPVVFCGVNDLQQSQIKGVKLMTGVNEEADFKGNIELILRLHPKTKQIVFINEWTITGEKVHEAFLKAIIPFQQSLDFLLLEDVDIDEILSKIRNLSADSIVFYTAFSRDRSGKTFEFNESIALVAQNCRVPIYTSHEFNVGYGVVGGIIVTGYDQGEAAAQIALRILQGTKVEDIPVRMSSPKRHIFDFAQIKRFNIAQDMLPQDSTIVNLPQTLYFKYKIWIYSIIASFIVLIFIISVLLINIQKRRQIEKELIHSREEIRALVNRLSETEEKERKKLARELHDQVGQNLTVLGVNLNLLRSLSPADGPSLIYSSINDSLTIIKQTTERIRNLMSNLRSPVLDDYGLVAAIDLYGRQWSSRTNIGVIVKGPETDTHLFDELENAMFRIVQESLTNVVKHSKATQVVITVGVTQEKVYLSIEDNGIGYDMSRHTSANGERGWGLVTMSERALAVGGTCRIQSRPGLGTHVFVEVPV